LSTVSITVDQYTINKFYDVSYSNHLCQLSIKVDQYIINKFYDGCYSNHHCQLSVLQ
jgi:hypothetical protein